MSKSDQHLENLRNLVELERQEEMRQHERQIRELSGAERQRAGRAILHLRGRRQGQGLGGYLVKFMRNQKGEQLPETEISPGDLVMMSKQDPYRDDNPTGTVAQKTNYSLTIVFRQKPDNFVFSKGLRMDLYVNDITYQRMKDAIATLQGASGRLAELRAVILGQKIPETGPDVAVDNWFNSKLNPSQKEAVEKALEAEDLYLIHGPPGTGKTTTAIEVIDQVVSDGDSVLATADSNTAVDTMVEFLLEQGVEALRVGHPARVTPTLREHTLDRVIEDHPTYQQSRKVRDRAFAKKDERDNHTRPSGKYRRGMSDEQIKSLARKGKGSRGVSPDKIQSMAKWLEIDDEVEELFDHSNELEDRAVQQLIESADVVCTTNATAGSQMLENQHFDLVVIDEATQATEPSCLIPITLGDRVVMAGDHKQLPPVVKNEEAAMNGLLQTLFERMAQTHGETIKSLLTVQYRMHEKIMEFSNQRFYGGRLSAHNTVRHHTLYDLGYKQNSEFETVRRALSPDEPLVYLDTHRLDAGERQRKRSFSRENRVEAKLVGRLATACSRAGIPENQIAVIAPYSDQVDLIERQLESDLVEVDSVDGFQGREKEVIIISMTRSNEAGNIGFLADARRFNVALTRAKRKLIAVGDSSTIASDNLYRDFIDHIKTSGCHLDLDPETRMVAEMLEN